MYSEEKAKTFIEKICSLKLDTGEFAGQNIALEPWQSDWLSKLYGTIDEETGLRTYRESLLFIPSRCGKSTLSACLCMYHLMDPTEPRGEIYSAAPTREQAARIFEKIKAMTLHEPERFKHLRFNHTKFRIANLKTGSFFQALSSDAEFNEGIDASFILLDEAHAFPNRKLYDTLQARMGNRRQPLFVTISTAGPKPDPNHFFYALYERGKKVLDKRLEQPRFLPVVYEAPLDSDWLSVETWRKAIPSLGRIRKLEDLQRLADIAKSDPAQERAFRRYQLNQWVSVTETWIKHEDWAACKEPLSLEDFKGCPCYGGLDLGGLFDMNAFVLLFIRDDQWYVFPQYWCPETKAFEREQKDKVPYLDWKAKGYLTLTGGNATDYPAIRQAVLKANREFDLRMVAVDDWNARQFAMELSEAGVNVFKARQGFSLSPALKEFERRISNKTLKHGDNPILNWNSANVRVTEGTMGDIRLDKEKSTDKIDGFSAMANAAIAALSPNQPQAVKSVATSGSVFFFDN